MKWVSYGVPVTLVSALLISAYNSPQVTPSVSIASAQGNIQPTRAEIQSVAKIYVATYDALVVATFKAAIMENSPNTLTRRNGVFAELGARKKFDSMLRSLTIPSSAQHDVLKVVTSDLRIELDLRELHAPARGIVNGDPLNFYLAVAALAKDLGVETTTWPPVTPAGPTAGD